MDSLKVQNLHREEYTLPIETFYVGENTVIGRMLLDNISVDNHTGKEKKPFMDNRGEIKYLRAQNLFEDGEAFEL